MAVEVKTVAVEIHNLEENDENEKVVDIKIVELKVVELSIPEPNKCEEMPKEANEG